ncbi:DUF2510 domain-containing protein [Cellulosimicrobium sp. BIT-GX5]|uniref:DUF2510 domain-containing protein n=1 Tax=Cellulosimicrobium composti TaxID=2672572 RepID=A0A6N7ZFT4_9MICO|nr:DUF2510 domain-containing protein [Cellulosimicrobium composti]MTG88253.1 DUF2510 domain-containing protein [Cellulosimicrobium composti]
MSTPGGTPAPGWYDDGTGTGTQRYWDGAGWTEQTAPTSSTPPGAAAQAPRATPPGGQWGPGSSEPPTKPHPLGWVALAVAVLGFVFACIPGALIVGWVLLPIAFILAIVGLFLRGKKWPAITALILAVVGTVVGVIVFLTVVSDSVEEAFGGTDVTVSPPAEDESTDGGGEVTEEATEPEGDAADAPGSRENPVPLGTVISGSDFDVTINSVELDATDAVMAANEFNEAPPEGYTYALINATVTYTGEESGFALEVEIDYVTSTGEVLASYDTFAVPPEPELGLDELYNGGSTTGNTVIAVPAGDAGLVRVTPGVFADEVFVATQ